MSDEKKAEKLSEKELDAVQGGGAHDRYANQEVSHLKGEGESSGIAILTSNMKNTVDPAGKKPGTVGS